MSRVQRVQSKQSHKKTLFYVVLFGLIGWFLLTSGFSFLVNSSVFIGDLIGGKRSEYDYGKTPEFYTLEFNNVPVATNTASLVISGTADNLQEVTLYLNDKRLKKISVTTDGTFTTTIDRYREGANELYAIGKNTKTNEVKKTETISFSYATSKPVLEITEPSDGYKTPRDEVKIAGKTNGQEMSVHIQGFLATVDASGAFQSSVRLKDGENKITVSVLDQAGNKEEKTITVFYEK